MQTLQKFWIAKRYCVLGLVLGLGFYRAQIFSGQLIAPYHFRIHVRTNFFAAFETEALTLMRQRIPP